MVNVHLCENGPLPGTSTWYSGEAKGCVQLAETAGSASAGKLDASAVSGVL